MADFYSTKQVAKAAGVLDLTIHRHVQKGWLVPEKIDGVNGFRFRGDKVKRWLAQRYPERPLSVLDAPTKEVTHA